MEDKNLRKLQIVLRMKIKLTYGKNNFVPMSLCIKRNGIIMVGFWVHANLAHIGLF